MIACLLRVENSAELNTIHGIFFVNNDWRRWRRGSLENSLDITIDETLIDNDMSSLGQRANPLGSVFLGSGNAQSASGGNVVVGNVEERESAEYLVCFEYSSCLGLALPFPRRRFARRRLLSRRRNKSSC